ncbi:hypothetical protein GCK72_003382 [Caenorhabditis remanei]|uniref:Uncharacterized protein n=1 Tax=Caenorhabditis remanei TaxID=31234 RepID=A0A6A5HV82_CAERE|nr:hypothetical protein GCK72_003382 [Caenorhabditis remanei]KAF1771555.1 hypothetical protein GCK72_003382 [Caenorhabditis remanei]
MGKMETWEVTGRTEDTITVMYKRRVYKEETFPTSPGEKDEILKKEEMDDETRAVLKRLSGLNERIRKEYLMEKKPSKNNKKEDKKKNKNKEKRASPKPKDASPKPKETPEDKDDHVTVNGVLVRKAQGSEPCDHRGVPLTHPMAVTPFPGARSAAKRERARQMLKEVAKKMHDDSLKKKKKNKEKEEKNEKKEKKKVSSSSKSSKASKTSTTTSTKATKASTKSKSSNKKMGCDKCGSCQKCIHRCSQKHAAEQKVTTQEREKFLRGISRLRQKIVKPERSREKASQSPYDVTQSESEIELSSESSSKRESAKKKKSKDENSVNFY